MKVLTITLQLAAFAAIAGPSFAGGVFLSIGNPSAVGDPAAQGALATVRVLNDVGTSMQDVKIMGTAEGLVDGRRVTMPLRFDKLSVPGLSAIWWEQPKHGTWVLNLSASDDSCVRCGVDGYVHLYTFDAIPVRSGVVRPQVKVYSPSATGIDDALRRLASDVH
jgi:hypothetical protein